MEQQDNNMEQQQDTAHPEALAPEITVGATLREARENAGMSVEEVAERIKFAPRQIEALESGDFSQLPEMAFIRGFVRSYARLLELDFQALLDALPGAPVPVAVKARSGSNELPRRGAERRQQNMFWLGGAVVLIAVVFIAWKYDAGKAVPQEQGANDAGEAVLAEAPASAVAAASAVAGTDVATGNNAVTTNGNEVTQKEMPERQVSPAHEAPREHAKPPVAKTPVPKPHIAEHEKAASAPAVHKSALQAGAATILNAGPRVVAGAASSAASGPSAAHAAGPSRSLRVEFSEDSWVEVKDGNGRLLLSMMGKQGSARNVAGPTPLHVVVGNASGVKLYFKGQPVELAPPGGSNVVRLKLE